VISPFFSQYFLKEIEIMFSVFLSSNGITRACLGNLEKAAERSPVVRRPTTFLVVPNFLLCLYNSIKAGEKVALFLKKENVYIF